MSMQVLHPRGWLPAIGYANGISVAAGRIVFIAGQVGWDADQRFQT
jgi:enamine deaminase RidA (YjgF/YER057c/UK114 family)